MSVAFATIRGAARNLQLRTAMLAAPLHDYGKPHSDLHGIGVELARRIAGTPEGRR